MTKEEAVKEAKRIKQYFPFRIVFIAGKDNEWDAYATVTKAKMNTLIRKGYEVLQLKSS